ncbi:MAG: hypothetical protein IJ206_04060 [Oscillospiraceae bacterium]|nr:hypothetical protein [Oscillospiraceae bacterium]
MRQYDTRHDRKSSIPPDGADRRSRERGHGRGGRTDSLIQELLDLTPDTQVIFVGSLCCLRHQPFGNAGQLLRSGRFSILCPSMTDFSSGRYLHQIVDAIVELSQERNSKHFALIHGCQWTILSTDGSLLQQELKEQHGIELVIKDDSHLLKGNHA